MQDLRHATSVLIADPRPLNATGIARLLDNDAAFAVVASCHTAEQTSQALLDVRPAVVLLDPGLYGTAFLAVQAIRARVAAAAILMMTATVDEPLLHALTYPATSCVTAYSPPDALLQALRAVISGETVLSQDAIRALAARHRQPAFVRPTLTRRETDIFREAAKGRTAARIAKALHISESTVKTHLRRAYDKLGAPNRSAAIAIAISNGILDRDHHTSHHADVHTLEIRRAQPQPRHPRPARPDSTPGATRALPY